jgi:uncharacterized protein (DUF2267 family)
MRTAARWSVASVMLVGGAVLLRPGTRVNKLVCHQLNGAGRRLRYLGGRLQGSGYLLRGRHPDPEVIDNVLADRIRSSLGALEKRLDLPHIHVMVDDHVALLHGEVTCDADVDKLTEAVAAVSGVVGVESYLHVGLTSGDTRPSAGRAVHPPSEALQRLLDAATDSGVPPDSASAVVRVILAIFADRLPRDEQDHVAAHLPADVRSLFTPPRRTRHEAPPRSVQELVARIAAATGELPSDTAEQVTAAVLENLRTLVPEEAADVGAVLPPELRDLWQGHAAE